MRYSILVNLVSLIGLSHEHSCFDIFTKGAGCMSAMWIYSSPHSRSLSEVYAVPSNWASVATTVRRSISCLVRSIFRTPSAWLRTHESELATRDRGDGTHFFVRADEKLTAFLELESALRENCIDIVSAAGRIAPALSPLGVSPRSFT